MHRFPPTRMAFESASKLRIDLDSQTYFRVWLSPANESVEATQTLDPR